MIEQEATMKPTGSNSFNGRRSRRARPLSQGLDKRLASYAAAARAAGVGSRALEAAEVITRAASTAGVGLLLSAGPASARIVYTPAYTMLPSFATLPLDLNHDGIVDFKFHFAPFNTCCHNWSSMFVFPAQGGNAILGGIQGLLSGRFGGPFTCRVASALPAGHSIGPGGRFGAYQTMLGAYPFFSYGYYSFVRREGPDSPHFFLNCGNWPNAQAPFLGLGFMAQGQKHFGWARLNWVNGTPVLMGYAYETEPNKPIRAGDTGPVADARAPEKHSAPPAVATLRPATLGVLALGSRGLYIWRKEQ
jgi:hypothetical protein